jgi:hypothetical protein
MVEKRQTRLAANAAAIERWQRRLFRAANELKKLTEQRKRLLKPRANKLAYDIGGAAGELNDKLTDLYSKTEN